MKSKDLTDDSSLRKTHNLFVTTTLYPSSVPTSNECHSQSPSSESSISPTCGCQIPTEPPTCKCIQSTNSPTTVPSSLPTLSITQSPTPRPTNPGIPSFNPVTVITPSPTVSPGTPVAPTNAETPTSFPTDFPTSG